MLCTLLSEVDMKMTTVGSRRFLETPTIMDSWVDEFGDDVVDAVSEKDQEELQDEWKNTSGLESLYGTLVELTTPVQTISSITGNESNDGIISRFIQWIKNFFKGIYNFFTGKSGGDGGSSNGSSKKEEDAFEKIDSHFEEGKVVTVPKTYAGFFEGSGKPKEDMRWVGEAVDKQIKFDTLFTSYIREMAKVVGSIKDKPIVEAAEILASEAGKARKSLIGSRGDLLPGTTLDAVGDVGISIYVNSSNASDGEFELKANKHICLKHKDLKGDNEDLPEAYDLLEEKLVDLLERIGKEERFGPLGKVITNILKLMKSILNRSLHTGRTLHSLLYLVTSKATGS